MLQLLSKFWRPRHRRRRVMRSTNESALDRLLIGRSKAEVHKKLGPPRSATFEGQRAQIPGDAADRPTPRTDSADQTLALFWSATTWFYAFDSAARTAMAVHFNHRGVRRVELIRLKAHA